MKLFSALPGLTGLLVLFLVASPGCRSGSAGDGGESSVPAENESVRWFHEVTDRAGLDQVRHRTGARGEKWMPETFGAGGGFIDYNRDEWPDILLVGGGVWTESDEEVRAIRLFRNDQNGSFTEVTEKVGLSTVRAYGMGITVADYDNDSDDDFYFTTLNGNQLFRNDGGLFTNVSTEAGVGGGDQWSTCSIFFDADRDGYLDLYVCNYVEWTPETDLFCTPDGDTKGYCTPQEYEGIHGRFFKNRGDGTFEEWTEQAGFADVPGKSLGVTALDYNRDGWPDLAVANDTRRDLLFENNGDGTFDEKGITSGIAFDETGTSTGGMGIDAGVVDSTGQPTIFVGNFAKEAIGVYRHGANGMFRYRSSASRIGHPTLMTLAFGLFLFDFDLDTDLDLFVANGHVQPLVAKRQDGITYKQAPQLFVNRGDGTFAEGAPSGALTRRFVARGAAHADVDRDGDEDILITENGGPVHLLINRRIRSEIYRGNNHVDSSDLQHETFLRVHLEGTESNTDGVGARVTATVRGRTMERYVQTGSSYLSASGKTVTFGLGGEKKIEELIVQWPSGNRDTLRDIRANQRLQITEGADTYRSISRRQRSAIQ